MFYLGDLGQGKCGMERSVMLEMNTCQVPNLNTVTVYIELKLLLQYGLMQKSFCKGCNFNEHRATLQFKAAGYIFFIKSHPLQFDYHVKVCYNNNFVSIYRVYNAAHIFIL